MWKIIALIMSFIAVLSVVATGVMAIEVKSMNAEMEEDITLMSNSIDVMSEEMRVYADAVSSEFARVNAELTEEIQTHANSTSAEFARVNAELIKEIVKLDGESENGSRFHYSRDVREILEQTNGSDLALEDVTNLWEECLEERMGLEGVFYAADMVDWWEGDYWQDLSEDGRKADLLYTGSLYGCWQ